MLGDRYGTSCASELTDLAAQILTRRGYSVGRNKPYAGGFITEHYGQPARGLHAMQIEVNRSLYMDERTLETHGGFAQLSADLAHLVGELGRAFEAGFLSPSGRKRPNRRAPHQSAYECRQEKGPLACARRPKSREETPKEGSAISLSHRNILTPHCKKSSPEGQNM